MPTSIAGVAQAVAVLAAAIHVYIFALESLMWMNPATRAVFRVRTTEAAETLRPMAFNQGFYNLFLALGVVVGWLMTLYGDAVWVQTGIGMMLLALASMAGAALVQGAAPALALVLILLL
jgi:putative membrane protein